MSKHYGFICQSHNPSLISDHWLNWGQEVLAEVYRRERAGAWPDDEAYAAQWPGSAPEPLPVTHGTERYEGIVPWLREHPHCVVALHNEYGEVESLDLVPATDDTCCGQPRDDEGRCVHRSHHPVVNVMAHSLPFISREMHPIGALRSAMAFDSRDWSADRADAWLWGIVMGYDGDPDDPADTDGAWAVVAARHDWTEQTLARLRILHERFKATLPPDA